MTRREIHFTNVLRSRGVALLLSLAGIWMGHSALVANVVMQWQSDHTVGFPVPSSWLAGMPAVSFWVNAGLVILTAILMILINRRYNLLRTLSVFFAAYFVFTTMCMPVAGAQLTAGSLLAPVVMLCVWLMYSVYTVRQSSRRVFLVFALLTTGALFHYGFLLYLPVFFIGLGQMRIFSFKRVLAALIGIFAPVWIGWGMLSLPMPHMPRLFFTPPTVVMQMPGGLPFVLTVAFTFLVGALMGMANILRILSFNTRGRSYNGLLSLVALCTGVGAIVNFTDICFYAVLLSALAAFQVGLFFRYSASRRGYIAVLILLASYTALFCWQYMSPYPVI